MLVLCMNMFTRDHAQDYIIIIIISCNIVYFQLDIERKDIIYIAAALRMTCCNILGGCLFIHPVNYKISTLLPRGQYLETFVS